MADLIVLKRLTLSDLAKRFSTEPFTMLAVGHRNAAKTTFVRNILSEVSFPNATVFCGIEYDHKKYTEDFKNYPKCKSNVYLDTDFNEYDPEPNEIVIFDDCIYDNSWGKNPTIFRLATTEKRRKVVSTILVVKYIFKVPEPLRSAFDYMVLFRENVHANQRRDYDFVPKDLFPTFDSFVALFERTENYECMIIHLSGTSTRLMDRVFYYTTVTNNMTIVPPVEHVVDYKSRWLSPMVIDKEVDPKDLDDFDFKEEEEESVQLAKMPQKTKAFHERSYVGGGEIILQKGTVLYSIRTRLEKSWMLLVFHPSEGYRSSEDFVTPVELLRDVTLEFRVKNIRHMRLFAAPEPEVHPCEDGWITSVDNQGKVKIYVRNDPTVIRVIGFLPVDWSWTNGTIDEDGSLIPKNWGTAYPIGTVSRPAKFRLPLHFKQKIEEYKAGIERDDPEGTAFYRVLKNAVIEYT
jgi:hypothetical protein